MADILYELTMDDTWSNYLHYKISKKHLSKREERQITKFIESKEYKCVTDNLLDDNFCFNPPVKQSINKSGTTKKRVVYSFDKAESMTLKVMAFLLYCYDDKISDNCYSFRKNQSAKDAIKKVLSIPDLSSLYCLKLDISNYFNSIPADNLCAVLKDIIDDDPRLYSFLERLLTQNEAYENGVKLQENRGAMAGIAISPFFANIYLGCLDRYYLTKGIPYFRYSDDILLFFSSRDELYNEYEYLVNALSELGLSINPDKVHISNPGETIEFLGVSYKDGITDLSNVTMKKIKDKIRRKAHSLYRWRIKKHATFEQTAKVLIRVFNKKFYDDTDENSFTWSRWFFPIIDTADSLKEIDSYLLQYIRYLYKGRHYKGNYKITYEQIKELGYKSLVNEYYKYKKTKEPSR